MSTGCRGRTSGSAGDTVLDPVRAPAKELALLYHERWDIEGFFKQIKSVSSTREKIFRSKYRTGCGRSSGRIWGALRDDVRQVDAPITRSGSGSDLAQEHGSCYPVPRLETGSFPPHPQMMITIRCCWRESVTRSTRNAGDRSYLRVIKRKMSNFPVKRARHRQRRVKQGHWDRIGSKRTGKQDTKRHGLGAAAAPTSQSGSVVWMLASGAVAEATDVGLCRPWCTRRRS